MALTVHWRHITITDSGGDGYVTVSADQPQGTHAVAGGGWLGGPLTSTVTNGSDAVSPATAQFTDYDSGTDTRYWTCVFALPPGGTARAHVWAGVDD